MTERDDNSEWLNAFNERQARKQSLQVEEGEVIDQVTKVEKIKPSQYIVLMVHPQAYERYTQGDEHDKQIGNAEIYEEVNKIVAEHLTDIYKEGDKINIQIRPNEDLGDKPYDWRFVDEATISSTNE